LPSLAHPLVILLRARLELRPLCFDARPCRPGIGGSIPS
jgi:hypothetical protein